MDRVGYEMRGNGGTTRRGTKKVAATAMSAIATASEARTLGYDIGLQLHRQGCTAQARNYYRALFLGGYDLKGDKRKAWIRGFDAGYHGHANRLGRRLS